MANLLMALYDLGRSTFTTAEAAQITGLARPLASSLLEARLRALSEHSPVLSNGGPPVVRAGFS
jgi:hypothetical protein